MSAARRRILVATADTLGRTMAGPGIRAYRIAAALAREHEVVLVTTTAIADISDSQFEIRAVDDDAFEHLVGWSDVIVLQGWVMAGRRFISESDKVVVVDVYDPMHLEQLEQARDAGDEGRARAVELTTAVLNEQLLRADYVLCASEKQRDFWLGHLASLGRINAATYDRDSSARALIDVVPFGVDDEPPARTGPGAKGVIPGIAPDDQLVLWGGGIYNWFDPLSLIRAIDRARVRCPAIRLLFMGGRHPNPEIPQMAMAVAAQKLASELGLLDRHVFFNEGWVPHDERQNFLLDADVAVSTHVDHLETAFSFRTRVLDYIWAGVPIVATVGDGIAELIERRGLGVTVAPQDPEATEAAIVQLLEDPARAHACRANAAQLAPELRWNRVLEPLLSFCRSPRRAADLVDPRLAAPLAQRRRAVAPPPAKGLRRELTVARDHLRVGGLRLLARRIGSRVRRIVVESRSPDA